MRFDCNVARAGGWTASVARLVAPIMVAVAMIGVPDRDAARAETNADPVLPVLGRWLTRDADGVFEIDRCGAVLCGRLVGMRYSGTMPTDTQHHPQCGLTLLETFVPTEEPGHFHGTIRDPDNDHRYQATIWSPQPGVLKLHGYLLLPILGQTQQWTRYTGPIGENCKLPPP